jgi:hypothetical protein
MEDSAMSLLSDDLQKLLHELDAESQEFAAVEQLAATEEGRGYYRGKSQAFQEAKGLLQTILARYTSSVWRTP